MKIEINIKINGYCYLDEIIFCDLTKQEIEKFAGDIERALAKVKGHNVTTRDSS